MIYIDAAQMPLATGRERLPSVQHAPVIETDEVADLKRVRDLKSVASGHCREAAHGFVGPRHVLG